LGESATAERAKLPHADILVMESTYGHPDYRLPPRQQVLEQLFAVVRQALDDGAVPIIQAYTLGKSQEVTRLLTAAGIPVLQHCDIFAVSQVYEACGMNLGQHERFTGAAEPGWAVIVPPGTGRLEQFGRQVRIAVTGWALDPRTKYRLGVDHAVPLSDHADFDELFEAVARVEPRVVYCTHGPESFVDRLRDVGYDARPLRRPSPAQKRLF
jgi:Cft2 family RNA processing exonuclease